MADWSKRSYPYLLIALAVVVYSNTVGFGYALDDHIVITKNRFTTKGVAGLVDIFTHDAMAGFYTDDTRPVAGGRYRPLALATHAVEYQLFGPNPTVSHLVNVIGYAATVFLLYLLLQRLFPASAGNVWYRNVPFLATAFFAVHPLHTEVVANIKGRDDLLSLLLGLAALLWWLRWVEARAHPGRDRLAGILAGVCFFASLMSKESTLAFVVLAPAILWYFRRKSAREVVASAVPLFLGALAYIALRFAAIGWGEATIAPELMNEPFLHAVGTQKPATVLLTLLLYLKLLVFPQPLTHDYYPYHVRLVDFSHPLVLVSLVVHAALVVVLVTGLRRRTVASFCVLWYFAALALYANVVFGIGTFMNERFLYVASVAFCVWLAWVLVERAPRTEIVVAVSMVVILAGATKTFARNFAWRDDVSLALTDVATSSGSARAQMAAGWAHLTLADDAADDARKRDELAQAVDHLTRSVAITDDYFPAQSLLGGGLVQSGRYAEALPHFAACFRMKHADPVVMNDLQYLAEHAAEAKDFTTAVQAYELMVAQRPSADAYAALGKIYGKELGNLPQAEAALAKGLALEPRNASLNERLGIVYAMGGRFREAVERFDAALALDKENAGLYRNKGMALRQLGRVAEGDELIERASQMADAPRSP